MSNYDISARDVASQAIEHFLQGGDSLAVIATGNAWLFKEFTRLIRHMLAQRETPSLRDQFTSDTSVWVQESRPFEVSRLFVIRAHESSPESFAGFSAGNELFMAVGDISQNCLMALLGCATKSNCQLIHYTMPPLLNRRNN